MTDQEKNEQSIIQKNGVLLDWAGFSYEGDKYWIYPDGTRHFHNWVGEQLMIDLYGSLDLQAKWLWPIAVTRGWFDKVLLAIVDAAYDRDPIAPASAEALLEHRDEDWRAPMGVKP
ncbi:hypothetical protein LCGC14_2312080 [marine sediment metagenome]|uniref:Uncharacterized protein n=1 Tax=marine sediment metagenome TaxID=412755 RepID=A0A0F9CKY1_9ZZZZ